VFTVLFAVLFLGMAVELVLLTRQNRALKASLAETQGECAAAQESVAPSLRIGDVMEPLTLGSLAGETIELAFDDPRGDVLLLIFSARCPACNENLPNWKRIERIGGPEGPRIYYVSTDEETVAREFAAEHELQKPVLVADSRELHRVNHIPTTIQIGPEGIVRNVWVGVLPAEALVEIERSTRADR